MFSFLHGYIFEQSPIHQCSKPPAAKMVQLNCSAHLPWYRKYSVAWRRGVGFIWTNATQIKLIVFLYIDKKFVDITVVVVIVVVVVAVVVINKTRS